MTRLKSAVSIFFWAGGAGFSIKTKRMKNRRLAAILTLIFFALAHAGTFGWSAQLLVPFILGAFLTLLYLWRGNLIIAMVMHTLVDTIGIILVPLAQGH